MDEMLTFRNATAAEKIKALLVFSELLGNRVPLPQLFQTRKSQRTLTPAELLIELKVSQTSEVDLFNKDHYGVSDTM